MKEKMIKTIIILVMLVISLVIGVIAIGVSYNIGKLDAYTQVSNITLESNQKCQAYCAATEVSYNIGKLDAYTQVSNITLESNQKCQAYCAATEELQHPDKNIEEGLIVSCQIGCAVGLIEIQTGILEELEKYD